LVNKFTTRTYNMSNLHILKENDKMQNAKSYRRFETMTGFAND